MSRSRSRCPSFPKPRHRPLKAPDYAGGGYEPGKHVYLKPAELDTLRATPFLNLNKLSLARILGIYTPDHHEAVPGATRPRCPGRDNRVDPVEVAEMPPKSATSTGKSSRDTRPPTRAAYIPPVRPEPKPEPTVAAAAPAPTGSASPPGHVEACGHVPGHDNPKLTTRLVTEIRARTAKLSHGKCSGG